jgi:hypothetical protein
MNTRLIIATLVGGIVSFFLGWLIFGVLLMNYYEANTTQYAGLMREMPNNIILIIIANLANAFLLAFIFQRWAGIKTIVKGLLGGMLVTFLIILSMDFYLLAWMNLYTPTSIIVDIIVNTAFGGIIGGIIGWVLGFQKKVAA